jgi:hypothetical protein
MIFASVPLANAMSPFAHHVRSIVGGRTNKQVRGPHTQAVVAMVANEHARRDGPAMEFV